MCGTLALVGGIALSRLLPYTPWLWLASLIAGALAVLARKRRRAMACLSLIALLLLGSARGGIALMPPDLPPVGKWSVEGAVTGSVSQSEKAVMFWLCDVRIQPEGSEEWIPIRGNLYCYYPTSAGRPLAHGQRIAVSGRSYLPQGARNPGGFDQRMWMAQNGAHVRLYATAAPQIIAPAAFSIRGWALRINESLSTRMDAVFGQAAPVIRAMLLGDQTGIPEEWSQWMQLSGIAHILSVSGLHVALWYGLLERSIRPLQISPWVRWVLLAALLCAYALITGLRPSVLRAVIMLLAVQGAHVARRKADTLTNLSLSALIILLFRPLDLFSAGFQLSFSAVLGIILLRPAIMQVLSKRGKGLSEALSVTLSAQIGILPVSTHWFGTTPLLAVLLNLIAIPLTGLLIPVAALATLLDAIWTPLGFLLVEASRGMVAILLLMTRLAASLPLAYIRIGAFAWWTMAACLVCMLLCSSAVIWKWRARLAAMGVAAALAIGAGFFAGSYWVRYVQLDVGQALSGVLHVGRATYVYDTGDKNSDLTEYLLYTGSTVDGLFLSHPHADHIGGLQEMLDAGIAIDTLYVPANADAFGAESNYDMLLSQSRLQGAEIIELSAGDMLNLSGLTVSVIAPTREVLRGNDPNDRSLVLLLEIGEHALMLMGDADGPAEPLGVDTDVLQVAHHGSRNAARDAFLADATPDIALISVGTNSYGHPHEETLQRLEDAHADIYITQDAGAVTLYFQPNGIRVEEYCR